MVSNDQVPVADLPQKQSPERRDEDEKRRVVEAIEPAMIQLVVSDTKKQDSSEVDQSTAQDLRVEQSAITSKSKSVVQLTVALVFAGGSFGVMYAVPGGLNELGRAVKGDTIAFNVFFVADTLAFLSSPAVAMIVATVSHRSAKMEYSIRFSLWAAAVCFVLTFHAAAYVVVLPNHKWIVLCFGSAATMPLALLLLYQLFITFYHDLK